MTEINDKLISSLSKLSMLEFSSDERKTLLEDMRDMIRFAENMNSFIAQTRSEEERFCALREDTVLPSADKEQLLSPSHASEDPYIKVPLVVDTKEAGNE